MSHVSRQPSLLRDTEAEEAGGGGGFGNRRFAGGIKRVRGGGAAEGVACEDRNVEDVAEDIVDAARVGGVPRAGDMQLHERRGRQKIAISRVKNLASWRGNPSQKATRRDSRQVVS